MKKTSCALIAGVSLMLAGIAHAGTIDFDDVNANGDFASLADISPYAGLSWSADWTGAAHVPEPGSPLMLAIGLLALGAGRHQARRSSAGIVRLAA